MDKEANGLSRVLTLFKKKKLVTLKYLPIKISLIILCYNGTSFITSHDTLLMQREGAAKQGSCPWQIDHARTEATTARSLCGT